ncbi:hypothetical protein FRC00_001113 [Tulasnella sp. 408]|nr:hypothetical protein FRC00_001113 [Tulasnella sp. 408]
MHPEAGTSKVNLIPQTPRHDSEEAKQRIVKVTMEGGPWTVASMLERVIPESTVRDAPQDQETNGSRRETGNGLDPAAPGPPQKRRRLSSGGTNALISPGPSFLQGLLDMVDNFTWALAQEFNSAPLPPDFQPAQRGDTATATAGANSEPGQGDGVGESSSAPRLSAKAKGKCPMK